MLTALRVLLLEGELPLNRNGAAGWIKDNSCWLVSKRTIDAIRDQLTTEGHTGLPSKNGRMYDILQEHGILSPCGDKATWKVAVSGDGWENELTVINIPISKIWLNQENEPEEFDGTITPSENSGKNIEEKKINKQNGKVSNETKDNTKLDTVPSPCKNKKSVNTLDIPLFLPSSLEDEREVKNDLKTPQKSDSDNKLIIIADDGDILKNSRKPDLKKENQQTVRAALMLGFFNGCRTEYYQEK